MSRLSLRPGRYARAWVLVVGLGAAPVSAESLHDVPTFSAGVEIVNLNLSVTDARQRHVGDVDSRELAVYEDGVRQDIALFSRDSVPLSLVVLIDGSSSMERHLPLTQAAAERLLQVLGPEDEAQVAQFDRRVHVLQDFTSDVSALRAAVRATQAYGDTALYDALYVVLKESAKEHRADALRRRAIVVLSDGEDTKSLVSDDQVLELARRADMNVYTIGLPAESPGVVASPLPTYFLGKLATETGGQAFFPKALDDLDGVFARVAEELRTLYAVGYVSSNPRRDGGWRRIAIQTARASLRVHHRTGYYAPSVREASSETVPRRPATADRR